MNSQMKRYIGQGLEGSPAQELLSPWSWSVPPSWHVDVFTNPEALCTSYFGDFYGGSSCRHD